nr:hypothetical protein [Roseburia inulinivorans]
MRELKNTKIIAVDAVEYSLKQALPLFLSGLTAGMVQREPQIRRPFQHLKIHCQIVMLTGIFLANN